MGASRERSQEKGAYILEWEVQILVCLTIYMTAYKFLVHTVPHPSHLLNNSKTASMASGTQKNHLRLPRTTVQGFCPLQNVQVEFHLQSNNSLWKQV